MARMTIRAWTALLLLGGSLGAGCDHRRGVTEVEPQTGTVGGGETITVRGDGFEPGRSGVQVRFGKLPATGVSVDSPTMIKVTTPAGRPGPVDVEVIFDDGAAIRVKNGFRYVEAGVKNPWEHFGEKKK